MADKHEEAVIKGYTGEDCPKCGRMRVELWEYKNKTERVCEKCNWNLDKEEYEIDDV